jgi:hypothetical protein
MKQISRIPLVDAEWEGAVRVLQNVMIAGETRDVTVALWMELPGRKLLVATTGESDQVLIQALEEAISEPNEGKPRRPRRIRLSAPHLVDQVRAVAGPDTEISVGDLPGLQPLLDKLEEGFSVPTGLGYLSHGASPEQVERFFRAAARLYRADPWSFVGDRDLIRLDIPDLQIEAAVVVLMQHDGTSGMVIYHSVDDLLEMLAAVAAEEAGWEPLLSEEPAAICVRFEKKKDLSADMLEEIEKWKWPAVARSRYPMIITKAPAPIMPGGADEIDILTATAAIEALVPFLEKHRGVFDEEEVVVAHDSFDTTAGEVHLEFPDLAAFSAVQDFFDPGDEEEDDLLEFVPSITDHPGMLELDDDPFFNAPEQHRLHLDVGRNDPCPCGSGKKYKKCHLGADRPVRSEASGLAEVHAMDNRLVQAICKWAGKHGGDEWPGWDGYGIPDTPMPAAALYAIISAWHEEIDGRRAADLYAAARRNDLSKREKSWLEAQAKSWLSIWRIERIDGETLHLHDVITGERRQVIDRNGSRTMRAGDAILARIVDFEGVSLMAGAHDMSLPVPAALQVATLASGVLGHDDVPATDELRSPESAIELLIRWDMAVVAMSEAPRLQNTDGEALYPTEESWSYDPSNHQEIVRQLGAVATLEQEPGAEGDSVRFVMLRADDDILMASFSVGDGTITAITNSSARAAAARAVVENACGALVARGGSLASDLRWSLQQGVAEDDPAARIDPDEPGLAEHVRSLKSDHYRKWLDVAVPALGNLTPREAASSDRGRIALEILLRDLERIEADGPPASRYDVNTLRRELGL